MVVILIPHRGFAPVYSSITPRRLPSSATGGGWLWFDSQDLHNIKTDTPLSNAKRFQGKMTNSYNFFSPLSCPYQSILSSSEPLSIYVTVWVIYCRTRVSSLVLNGCFLSVNTVLSYFLIA
jgi:hypothetical protein